MEDVGSKHYRTKLRNENDKPHTTTISSFHPFPTPFTALPFSQMSSIPCARCSGSAGSSTALRAMFDVLGLGLVAQELGRVRVWTNFPVIASAVSANGEVIDTSQGAVSTRGRRVIEGNEGGGVSQGVIDTCSLCDLV